MCTMAIDSVAKSSCEMPFLGYWLKLLSAAMPRCLLRNKNAGENPCHLSLAKALRSTLVVKLRSVAPPEGKGSSVNTIVYT